jgi:antitoxin (DNA-binding transcriptional repressor) of toxin-antitoxin stability system
MVIKSDDIVPMNQACARFTDLAEEVRAGAEKIITRDGESYVAHVHARRLDHYHRLEREHIHIAMLAEAAPAPISGGTWSESALSSNWPKPR